MLFDPQVGRRDFSPTIQQSSENAYPYPCRCVRCRGPFGFAQGRLFDSVVARFATANSAQDDMWWKMMGWACQSQPHVALQ